MSTLLYIHNTRSRPVLDHTPCIFLILIMKFMIVQQIFSHISLNYKNESIFEIDQVRILDFQVYQRLKQAVLVARAKPTRTWLV